jgi:signal transduction histidine kinase
MICPYFDPPIFFFFSEGVPLLLYYSHIPVVVVSLLIGFFVLLNGPHILLNRLFFAITFFFSLWVIIDLITWTNIHSDTVLFLWSLWGLLFTFIAIFSIYFIYVFLNNKDAPASIKIIFLLLSAPVFLLSATDYNVSGFNLVDCDAFMFENIFFHTYYISLGMIAIVWNFILLLKHYRTASRSFKKQIILMGTGIESFLFMFFSFSYIGSYLTSINVLEDSRLEMYGLFGMIFFMILISYLIVKFKSFNIKLLGAQALVVALLVLIGSQFTYIEDNANKLLNAIALIASCSIGLLLIRSVRKVDQQKELLDIANREQENLIHFISHQIKGFFTKSRNIFSTMNDEKDSIPSDLHNFIDEGIRSDNEGIKVVTDILNAANLKTGKIQFNKNRFYLNLLVENIIDHNKSLADKKGIALKYNSPGKIIEFNGDEARLKDAIGNIINNSVNYTITGEVKIDLIQGPKQIKIVVTDTGVGLTDADKSKLFNSGSRGADSLKYNVNSTGYGLYIAKRVVEGHGGTIIAESAGRDKGSTFTIILPN